jgi:hypothetical protein
MNRLCVINRTNISLPTFPEGARSTVGTLLDGVNLARNLSWKSFAVMSNVAYALMNFSKRRWQHDLCR